MKSGRTILVVSALLALLATNLSAQLTSATLTGVVSDPSGAVIPQAKVTLTNEKTGDSRDTVTNSDGYYTFAGMAVGDLTYKLTVEAKGFVKFDAPGIQLLNGEKRNVNVTLKVGNTSETVEVLGVADSIVPVDSGEKSETLTTAELQNYVQVGSNAAEYIKIMPGFGISNGTNNSANYTGEVIGINGNGAAGSQSPLNGAFSYNGLPPNTLDITADGAHVSDPGCNCDTPVNPNSDMISEFKVMAGNFSAENQKGPIVISSIAKSGGSAFHGSAFFYARDYVMNANDWIYNKDDVAKPQNKFFYPGGTIGGPVLIPGTNFNKNRNKLFFFTGFEYFYQVLNTSLVRATVPTASEMTGNFSPSSVIAESGCATCPNASGGPPGQLNANALTMFPGGQIPQSMIDPNMVALMKLFPAVNANPLVTGGYNYVSSPTFNQNNTQWMSRVDYNISDNTKLFVRYNLQRETQQFPVGLWWTQDEQVPYPTNILGKNRSDSISSSLTHVFSPSMTNEFVFSYTYIGFPNVFADPSKVNRSDVGYTYNEIYKNNVSQIPSFGGLGWTNQESALIFNPGGFEVGGPSAGLYADKWMPNVSDTLTKVAGTHTVKGGFFWEWIRNAQPNNLDTNGELNVWGNGANAYTFGNEYADLITGNLYSYTEASFNNVNNESYNTYEFFLQDDWKVTRRLTLNYGMRFTHFQPWVDRTGHGFPTFIPSDYNASASPLAYSGWEWNAIDSSIPVGGFPTRALFYQPRIGVAYDLTGSGKTVLRGGWGRYYYHPSQFTTGLEVSAGVDQTTIYGSTIGTNLYAKNLSSINFANAPLSPNGLNLTDNEEPYTDTWNVTVSRRTPWSSLLEVSYVGNRSRDLLNNGAGAGSSINLVPVGAMLASNNNGANPNTLNTANFVPYSQYNDTTYLATNNLYANYNALQVTWVRAKGKYNINFNYTYGKAMGIVNANADPFNLANNYGVQPYNRTHIFNAAYSIELGNHTTNKALGGFVNGWQLSGITQLESGANLTALSAGNDFNFGATGNVAGTNYAISDTSLLGTPSIQLTPTLTCNPTANLGPHQYINGSCFSQPTTIGQNGPTVLPAIYGPWFFNSDLGLFKNFQMSESKKLQFRVDGYNFLNHPLWSFYGGENLSLAFNSAGQNTSPLFGYTTDKQGHRIIQLAVKFYF
jgi:Carboxypeptidase regulatory-like domain